MYLFHRSQRGFSLTETMVSLAILSVTASAAVPYYEKTKNDIITKYQNIHANNVKNIDNIIQGREPILLHEQQVSAEIETNKYLEAFNEILPK